MSSDFPFLDVHYLKINIFLLCFSTKGIMQFQALKATKEIVRIKQ